MQLRLTGQKHRAIVVSDVYQRVIDNIDSYSVNTGMHIPYSVESFASALTLAGSSPCTIIIEKAVTISSDTTVPSTVTLDIRKGGSFSVASGKKLTINGLIITNDQTYTTIFTGAGAVDIGLHARSTSALFEIGTRKVIDERVFRYAKSISNLTELSYAVINSHIIPDDGYEGAVSGSPKAGDITITILDTGSAGARPVNYYKGAYIQIYRDPGNPASATNFDQQRRVISSTVGNGVSITLTLDYPLTCDVQATVDVYPCQYSEIAKAESVSSGNETFVGFAAAFLQAGEYGWVQTWGPCNGHYNIAFPGENGPSDRDCYFNQAGEIITLKQGGSFVGNSYQRAGYVIPLTKNNYGSVMIMLQLAP